MVMISQSFLQRDTWTSSQLTVPKEKENIQTYLRTVNTMQSDIDNVGCKIIFMAFLLG